MIKLPIAALVVIIGLLGGFYGGYKVGGGGTTAAAAGAATGARTAGNGLNGGRGLAACPSPGASPAASGAARRGATGTIANLTSNSLTIHDARCNTDVKITFDQSVIVRKTVVGQASDLQESETVTVTGTRQADGSIKANSINIVPAGSAGFGGFGGGAANGG